MEDISTVVPCSWSDIPHCQKSHWGAPQAVLFTLERSSLLGFFLHINIHDLPKPPQRTPSLLTHILNALAHQNNIMRMQNSKMREEEDAVTYENKQTPRGGARNVRWEKWMTRRHKPAKSYLP